MKALVYHGNRDIRLEEIVEPSPGQDDAKIRVDYCGICATDIEEYLYGPNFITSTPPNPLTGKSIPLIPGHELTGTIKNVGRNVTEVEIGQRVVINGVLSCMDCYWCADGNTGQCRSQATVGFAANGGLAEYIVWPASKLITLPDNVTSQEAALIEPASVANHAVKRGDIMADHKVVVLGLGTVGMLALQLAKNAGASVCGVDLRQISLDLADELGADKTILASSPVIKETLLEFTNGIGPDVIIDSAGSNTTPINAVNWVRPGGKIVLVAIYIAPSELNFNEIVSDEKMLLGSVGYSQEDMEEVVDMLSTGNLKTKPLISQIINLDDVIDKGFQRMMDKNKDVFKILVSP